MPWINDILQLGVANLFVSIILVAMVYDLFKFRIPNIISIALVVLFAIGALIAAPPVDWLSHIGAGLLLLGLSAVMWHFRWLGGGDVKLLAALSLWMGFSLLPAYLLLVGLIGGAFGMLLLIMRPRAALSAPLWGRIGLELPRVLRPGEAMPYGIAIGTAALLVGPGMPLLPWS